MVSFENKGDRLSFSKYYTPIKEIKDYNMLIDGKSFFDIPIKNKKEAYEHIVEMSKINDYTPGNLLDYDYFSKYYRLIATDLSKLMELEKPDLRQQITLLEGLLERKEQQCSLSSRNQKKRFSIFHNIL